MKFSLEVDHFSFLFQYPNSSKTSKNAIGIVFSSSKTTPLDSFHQDCHVKYFSIKQSSICLRASESQEHKVGNFKLSFDFYQFSNSSFSKTTELILSRSQFTAFFCGRLSDNWSSGVVPVCCWAKDQLRLARYCLSRFPWTARIISKLSDDETYILVFFGLKPALSKLPKNVRTTGV